MFCNDSLKIILSDLLKQRKEVYEKQAESESEIFNLSEELDALGPAPVDSPENEVVKKRRTELTNLIEKADKNAIIDRPIICEVPFLVTNHLSSR